MLVNFTQHYNFLKYIAGVKWGGHPKILNILYKNFIRNKMDDEATAYGNAPKTRLQKLDTLQNGCLWVVGGFSRTIPIHVLSAANTIPTPEQRRIWMTGKEVVKSVSLNTILACQSENCLMEKTALKIRHLDFTNRRRKTW
jgi:hypothetical protein